MIAGNSSAAIEPAPISASTRASGRARCLAATTPVSAVRNRCSQVSFNNPIGAPVLSSNTTSMWWERKPCALATSLISLIPVTFSEIRVAPLDL